MLSALFGRSKPPLLLVRADGKEVCRLDVDDLPSEVTPVVEVGTHGTIEFIDSTGLVHVHDVAPFTGVFHFSVRVHETLACQVDCVVGQARGSDPAQLLRDGATGIRFQPFFLPGAAVSNDELRGQGLFARGLHFNGSVTPGNVLLSCECDVCHRSFLIRSFHSGFSNCGYFYSGSGKYTLIVGNDVEGCPAALSEPDADKLEALEAALPKAPDGSEFRYLNPFRCPHCSAAYIDFGAHAGLRVAEYYGNHLVGSELVRHAGGTR